MTPAEHLAPDAETDVDSPEAAPQADPFVINLCSSSTPMALPKADLPELQRFKFFVSRRFEEGRERFRLHMGFFDTLAEAEGWLGLVREIYPGAWAGEAPGKKLRARAAAAAAEQAAHATGPHAVAVAPVPPPAPSPSVNAAPEVTRVVPTLQPPAGTLELEVAPAPKVDFAPTPSTPAAPASAAVLTLTPPATVRRAPAGKRAAESARTATPKPGAAKPQAAAVPLGNSNIKEVLASLDEAEATTAPVPAEDTRVMPALAAAALSDPQALQVLEGKAHDGAKPAAFAVQLQWSVQPILLDKVPPLAIFSAYTLYCIEGSREGRKWFGLRLGFFNDPISAKQVASYVRSEFAAVAVVPVSADERKRVSGDSPSAPSPVRAAPGRAPLKPVESRSPLDSGEFKLFDSDQLAAGPIDSTAQRAAVRELRPKSAAKSGGKVNARERRTPQTLEETLEILGANQLTVDEAKGGSVANGGPRKAEKSAPFTRLLERLGERVRKS